MLENVRNQRFEEIWMSWKRKTSFVACMVEQNCPIPCRKKKPFKKKSVKNLQEKKLLAQKAASLIKEKDVIFIDAGTTTAFLIHELFNKNVTVVTNSIHHAAQLVEKQIPTVMVGGSVKMATDASIGGVALNQINQLHFDRAFIGMNGVDDSYYTTPDMEEGAVKRAIWKTPNRPMSWWIRLKLGKLALPR